MRLCNVKHELYFPDGGKDVRRLLVEAGGALESHSR